ncbi:MAG: metallophosphoesterase [Terriglobia bacterium]
MARLIYTSDLHGHVSLYRAAGEAAVRHQADAIILGGDLCPGTPSSSRVDLPESQPEFLMSEVRPLVEEWKRARPSLRVFAIPGNDDCATIVLALRQLETMGLVEDLHRRTAQFGDLTLAGLAFVPPTPFSFKDFERRDDARDTGPYPALARCVLTTERGFVEIQDFAAHLSSLPTLEDELALLPATEQTIAVIHCPPHGTRCDVLFNREHIGSRALRRWIEARQPLLSLHGHIHESPMMSGAFADRVGRTVVVNPGCDHSRPHWVLIDTGKLESLEHSIYKSWRDD